MELLLVLQKLEMIIIKNIPIEE